VTARGQQRLRGAARSPRAAHRAPDPRAFRPIGRWVAMYLCPSPPCTLRGRQRARGAPLAAAAGAETPAAGRGCHFILRAGQSARKGVSWVAASRPVCRLRLRGLQARQHFPAPSVLQCREASEWSLAPACVCRPAGLQGCSTLGRWQHGSGPRVPPSPLGGTAIDGGRTALANAT